MQRVQLSVLDLILQINFLKQATGKMGKRIQQAFPNGQQARPHQQGRAGEQRRQETEQTERAKDITSLREVSASDSGNMYEE